MKVANFKHFGCADRYDVALKFINDLEEGSLISITSVATDAASVTSRYEKEKVTVWYWENK